MRREFDVNQDTNRPLAGRQGHSCGRKIFNILNLKEGFEKFKAIFTHAIFTELNKRAFQGRVNFQISGVVEGTFATGDRPSV